MRSATPFAGYRFPPDVIALAVRWYLRFRLSYADVAELLAERGVQVDPSTVFDWVRQFAPLYEDAARHFRHRVGSTWSVDETYATVAGRPVYVYVSARRATDDAATFFRRAIEATGVIPDEVATDCAATYPPALAAVLPGVLHETGKRVQQRIERNHQHLKGRLRPMRGSKTLAGARMLCRAHAFLRNLRGGFYDLARMVDAVPASTRPPVVHAWAALTGALEGVKYSGLPIVSLSTAIRGGNGDMHDPPATVARCWAAQARWQVRPTRHRPASAYRAHSRE